MALKRIMPVIGKVISLSLMLFIAGFMACNEKRPEPAPVTQVGIEPFVSEIEAKDYHHLLQSWLLKGYRNRTLIYASPVDGFNVIPDERLKSLKEDIKRKGNAPGQVEDGVTGGDYLYAAAEFGILKKVYWVIPFNYIDYIDAEVRIKQFLRNSAPHLTPGEIDSMKFSKGCVVGRLSGIQTHICSISSLPALQEPVMVAVNSGFFPAFAATKKRNILGAMKFFFDAMAARTILTDSLHVVSASDSPARQGYIHDELIAMFRDPDIFRAPVPPDIWSLRDQADNMLSGGGAKEALQLLKKRGHEYPDDPYLILMRVTAELMLGMDAEGLKTMEKKCPEDQLFCRGLVDAGLLLKHAGKTAQAADIFARVLQLDPGNARALGEQEKMRGLPAGR